MVVSRGVKTREEEGGDGGGEGTGGNRVVANRYHIRKKLGQGQYGTVYLVEDDQSLFSEEKLKVLKEIPVGQIPPDETIDAMREAKLQAKMDHVGIVHCFNNFLDQDFFCIITEYCSSGDLEELITKTKKSGSHLSETQVLDFFCQIVLATRYMHQKQILHRDLKPRNIFVKDDSCKLGDFGISRVLLGTADMASTFIGTPYYMSPEVLKHEGYDSKSDMWSLGVILYELCTLEHCFDGNSLMSVLYKITQGKIPKLPQTYSAELQHIYSNLVQRNQQKRFSAAQVLKDPFISTHLQKMKRRVSEQWVHAIDIATNILDQEPEQETSLVSLPPPPQMPPLPELPFIFETEVPGEDSGGGGAEVPRVATAPLEQQREEQPVGIDPETTITAVKTAAELAAERKREKQLEEERMIREATRNVWLENYKHRENVSRLYHSKAAKNSIGMSPHTNSSHSPSSGQMRQRSQTWGAKSQGSPAGASAVATNQGRTPHHKLSLPETSSSNSQYTAPVVPKPTRIASPDSVATRRVGTTQGNTNMALKASLSSSPEDQKQEDSGFSSVNVSAESSGQHDSWNNRPITAKHKHFDEMLEEELRKSGEQPSDPYRPSNIIPKKPFVPLKKGQGKQAYNSNANNQRNKKKKKRIRRVGGDQTDGGVGGSVDLEYGYEDDFEDYVESDSDEADGSEEAEMQVDVDDIVPGVDEMDVSGAGPRVSKKVKGTGAGGHPQNRQHPVLFADPFSPSIKAKKIDNMRRECIRKMGQRNFDKVYKYLHSARQQGLNESGIVENLNRLHPDSDHCFLVEQLIFLESANICF